MIPLAYVICANVNVAAPPPQLTVNQPRTDEHGSVEAELVAHSSHTHALYHDDNLLVYFNLKKTNQGTTYSASIRHKDGRGLWMALMNQYAGGDKWEAEIKKQGDLLHTCV